TGGYLGLYHNIKNIFEKFRNFAYKTKNSIFALCKNAICLQTEKRSKASLFFYAYILAKIP
ncbi:hypothetical protein, partial [Clostridium tarantellae]|uniref:hypothetical protein n=1 Tax=Clostridium tarantellae TaxID=39493 RepID=UPI001A9BAC60